MEISKYEVVLVPGDKSTVYFGEHKVLELVSLGYCKVNVELLPFDWSSIKTCVRKPKPVEVVDSINSVSDGLDEG